MRTKERKKTGCSAKSSKLSRTDGIIDATNFKVPLNESVNRVYRLIRVAFQERYMSMDTMVLEHMMNPKNYGTLPTANAEGMGKNPQNGEKVVIYIHVKEDEEKPYIDEITFQAIGCTTTIVAGSMLTEEAKGLTLDGARNLVAATMELLEKLPPEDAACSEMVALAIQAAVDTYEKRKEEGDYPPITYQVTNDCTPKEEAEHENGTH